MTKRGLQLRLKYALWDFYTDAVWKKWKVPKVKDQDFKETYRKNCDNLLLAMDKKSRDLLQQWLELKAMGAIRRNSEFLSDNANLINRGRLFENVSLKQDIERVIAQHKYKQEKESQKVAKAVKKQERVSRSKRFV